jgi:hypothetical protein
MMPTVVTKNLIAPRRKERKENSFFFELGGPFDFAQDMLCAFARETVLSDLYFIQNFNYLRLNLTKRKRTRDAKERYI